MREFRVKGGACNLPTIALVRTTYFQLAALFATKGRKAYTRRAARNTFSETITTQLQENQRATRCIRITTFVRQHKSFHVQEVEEEFRVDLRCRYCDCSDFQMDRYSCHHVIACCTNQNIDWQVYVNDIYRMDKISRVYEREFEVIGHKDTWLLYTRSRIHPNP